MTDRPNISGLGLTRQCLGGYTDKHEEESMSDARRVRIGARGFIDGSAVRTYALSNDGTYALLPWEEYERLCAELAKWKRRFDRSEDLRVDQRKTNRAELAAKDAAHKLKRQDDRIEELLAGIGRCERRAEADMNTIRALRKENEKLVDECCQLKEGYTSIRVQFATFTKTVGGAFANAFKEGFMEGWMDGKHGTSPDPSPVVDAAWEKSKHINFINNVNCGGDDG